MTAENLEKNLDYIFINHSRLINIDCLLINDILRFRFVSLVNSSLNLMLHKTNKEYATEIIDLRYSNLYYRYVETSPPLSCVLLLQYLAMNFIPENDNFKLKTVFIYGSNVDKHCLDQLKDGFCLENLRFDDQPEPDYSYYGYDFENEKNELICQD